MDCCGGLPMRVVQAMQDKATEGHTVDALAYSGDEGRAKLRKAAGSCKEALIRGCPNGATHPGNDVVGISPRAIGGRRTPGTETSKYRKEKKTTVISQVVASERETAQTWLRVIAVGGCRTTLSEPDSSRSCLESSTKGGESPVGVKEGEVVVS